jgi:hypothetical protein
MCDTMERTNSKSRQPRGWLIAYAHCEHVHTNFKPVACGWGGPRRPNTQSALSSGSGPRLRKVSYDTSKIILHGGPNCSRVAITTCLKDTRRIEHGCEVVLIGRITGPHINGPFAAIRRVIQAEVEETSRLQKRKRSGTRPDHRFPQKNVERH